MIAVIKPFLPLTLAVAAIGGFIWWIDHHAAERTRAAMNATAKQIENQTRVDLRASEGRLQEAIGGIGQTLHDQIGAIDTIHRTEIRPTLVKELTRETRFSDPAAGISDSVRQQINRALAAVACASRPDGGIQCAVQNGGAAPYQ